MGLARSLRAVVEQFGAAQEEYEDYDDYADDDEMSAEEPPPRLRRTGERAARPLALVRQSQIEFALVTPQSFDDAQRIADRLRADGPVIVDLQSCGPDLSKRLIDFCSGLTYALEGSLEFLGEEVVLLTPHRVELSSEALSGLQERRFFNQV
jgi:cell division inhibitor SepF